MDVTPDDEVKKKADTPPPPEEKIANLFQKKPSSADKYKVGDSNVEKKRSLETRSSFEEDLNLDDIPSEDFTDSDLDDLE